MLNITQAVTRSVRSTFDYKGRSRRSEYWWTTLFFIILVIAGALIDVFVTPEVSEADLQNYYGGGWKEWLLDWKYTPLSTGLYYLSLPTLLAVTARRMHDVGRAAWIGILPILAMELTIFVPVPDLEMMLTASQSMWTSMLAIAIGLFFIIIVFGIYAFVLSVMDSQRTTNRYGSSPKYSD